MASLGDIALEEKFRHLTDEWHTTGKITSEQVAALKATQKDILKTFIGKQGIMPKEALETEVDHFFDKLGLNDFYFMHTQLKDMSVHIQCLYAAKIMSLTRERGFENFVIRHEDENSAMFCIRSNPQAPHMICHDLELEIEKNYLDMGTEPGKRWRLHIYRTEGTLDPKSEDKMRFFFAYKPNFPESKEPLKAEASTKVELDAISDPIFLRKISPKSRELYTKVVNEAAASDYPVLLADQARVPEERRIFIAFQNGTTHSMFSSFSALYHSLGFWSPKKYVEQFANGVVVFSVYLRPLPLDSTMPPSEMDCRVSHLLSQAALLWTLPRTAFTRLFMAGQLTCEETAYSYCVWKFAHQFLNRYSEEYHALMETMATNPTAVRHLTTLKQRLRDDTFTERRVMEALESHPELLKKLYKSFAERYCPVAVKKSCGCGSSVAGVAEVKKPEDGEMFPEDKAFRSLVSKTVTSEIDRQIFLAVELFNRAVLKTNFFKRQKIAFGFRLNPAFLSKTEYSTTPFGVFFFVGAEFRGFHIRFVDIARGGVRLIKSVDVAAYTHNVGSLFDENYGLAHTQQRKNKDIPEGGSKGTILLSPDHLTKGEIAFHKYVDALMDVILPTDEIVDYYGLPEIIFLGPDENTADLMEWAALHSRERGYKYWKAFTTGKPRHIGGIPHDMFGMTTRSTHQYVLGILEKLHVDETKVTKFMTGGPDGDLGSNEILMSKDIIIGVVDGSGVLYDPKGINREDLRRLALARKMVKFFDRSKLGPGGFLVEITDRDFKLPDGTIVENGLMFRNTFHLNPLSTADLFVPCGGRPEAVNVTNKEGMFDATGKPRFKWIVEGANLFITQAVRLELEKAGVVLIKDASANKGGVTSSSLEVLASLALTDEEFSTHMCVSKDGKHVPKFYQDYVAADQQYIESNARKEFECLWAEHHRSGKPLCVLSDDLSNKINQLRAAFRTSDLFDKNPALRERVLKAHIPKVLLDLVGMDKVLERVPPAYLKAIFGATLAANFVYTKGLNANEFTFFEYLTHF